MNKNFYIKQEKVLKNYLDELDMKFGYDTTCTLAYDPKYLSNELGFRTAGSEAEHKAANYIIDIMTQIGLSEVEKVPVRVDGWQFNNASLSLDGGNRVIKPASYATSGTDVEGISTEIVYAGAGYAQDYETIDVQDKIVLIGIDQWNDSWISEVLREAYHQGAAALVSYDTGGYARISDDAINLQDVCQDDLIPCVSISANDGSYLKKQIAGGLNKAHLKVDSIIKKGTGISYNVLGKLKGKSSKQQIIIAGHYDVYFNGFQDDGAGTALMLTIAKALISSGYEPEYDILFIAHGAEEWGASGSKNDWTTGAWRMINEAYPQWTEKTTALINFELPAFYENDDYISISCVREFASFVNQIVNESTLFDDIDTSIFKKGISSEYIPVNTLEDGMSYRFAGVPYFVNKPETGDKWIRERYHTQYDDESTWNEDVMRINASIFGLLAIYMDQIPVIQLDFTPTIESLHETADRNIMADATCDIDGYYSTLKSFEEISEDVKRRGLEIENTYIDALEKGDCEKVLLVKNLAEKYNNKLLKAFKIIQDKTIGIINSGLIVDRHESSIKNIRLIRAVLESLESEDFDSAIESALAISGFADWNYLKFSKNTGDHSKKMLFTEYNPSNTFWGTGKVDPMFNTGDGIIALINGDGEKAKVIYEKALKHEEKVLRDNITLEIEGLHDVIKVLG